MLFKCSQNVIPEKKYDHFGGQVIAICHTVA